MELDNLTFRGPAFDEASVIVNRLPDDLLSLLRQINGFIQFRGGLHIRGVCSGPLWHSLTSVMEGANALYRLYPVLRETDVPFGQDCMADQFILRDQGVYKLYAETGDLEFKEEGLVSFLRNANEDSASYLELQPLLQFEREGNALEPGRVLHAVPPFCSKEAKAGVHLSSIPIHEALAMLPDMATALNGLKDGDKFSIKVMK
jgi:hypothetical protein